MGKFPTAARTTSHASMISYALKSLNGKTTINFSFAQWMMRKISKIIPANYERKTPEKRFAEQSWGHRDGRVNCWYCGMFKNCWNHNKFSDPLRGLLPECKTSEVCELLIYFIRTAFTLKALCTKASGNALL